MLTTRLTFVLVFIFIVVFSTNAQEYAAVKWIETTHDFGTFPEDGGDVCCKMRFVNIGDVPAVIINARATCGCTTPNYSKEKVAPGDTGMVEIKYSPMGRPGRFAKKVYVYMNTTPNSMRDTLMISGVVIGNANTLKNRYPIDAGSLRLRNDMVAFGEISKGRAKSVFLDAYNQITDTVFPTFKNIPSYISISMASAVVPPGEQTTFVFYFNTIKCPQWGVVDDEITLVMPPDTDKEFVVSTVAVVNEDFSALTSSQYAKAASVSISLEVMDFARIDKNGGALVGNFIIKNIGKSPLIVRRLYTADKGVSVSIDKNKIGKGHSATVTVEIDPTYVQDNFLNAQITVITNDPKNPKQIVRVIGEVK